MSIAADDDEALLASLLAGIATGKAGGSSRRKLLELIAGLLSEDGDSVGLGPCPVPPLGDEEILERLQLSQERRGVRPTSIRVRRRRIIAFMRFLDGKSILEAGREDVESYLDSLDVKPGTRRDYLVHLGCFYRWAIDEGLATDNPTEHIRRPRRHQGVPRPVTDHELLSAIDPSRFDFEVYRDRRLWCFLHLGAYAGLRCMEMAMLHVEDIDPVIGLIRVRDGKGGKQRLIPLHPEIEPALRQLPLPSSGPIFRRQQAWDGVDGPVLSPFTPSYEIARHFRSLGISGAAHRLRHWFATNVYRQSQDIRLTQELLGHSSPTTTAIYAAFDPSLAAPSVNALGVGPS